MPNGLTVLSVPQGFGAMRSFWRVYFDQPSSSDKSTYTAGIDTALVTDTALELLRAYAPAQPVRLLGVRLAGFDDLEPDRPPAPAAPVGQLVLPL